MRIQQWLCVLCFVFHAGLATGTCPENEYAQPIILDKNSGPFSTDTFKFSQADSAFPYGHLAAPQIAAENGLRIPTLQEAQLFLSDTSNCHPTNTNGMTTSVQIPVTDPSRASGYNYLQGACGHSAYNTVQQFDADIIVKMDGSGAWGNSGWNYKVYLFIVDVSSEISYLCQSCPAGTISPAGSTSLDTCTCQADRYKETRLFPPAGARTTCFPVDNNGGLSRSCDVTGENYGNGAHAVQFSSHYSTAYSPHTMFNSEDVSYGNDAAFASGQYNSNGIFVGSGQLNSDYPGDYIAISMPSKVRVTRIAMYMQTYEYQDYTVFAKKYQVLGRNSASDSWQKIHEEMDAMDSLFYDPIKCTRFLDEGKNCMHRKEITTDHSFSQIAVVFETKQPSEHLYVSLAELNIYGTSAETCTSCPPSTISPVGSISSDACVCAANTYKETNIQAQWPRVSFSAYENEFSSGGSLDNYVFSLWNGVSAKLISGWTHTASYAHGFLRSGAGDSVLEINGLVPGKEYLYATYNFHDPTHSTYAYSWGLNSFTLYVNGVQVASLSGQPTSSEPTYSGQVAADSSGKILFKFTHTNEHLHLSGLSVEAVCQACPSGASSPAGSTSSDACACKANTYAKPGDAVVEFNPADETFDGTNTGYDLGTTTLNIATAGFTVVTRVKFAAFQHWSSIFDFSDSNGDTANNNIRVNNVASTGKWSFDIREGGTVACQIYNQGTIELNTWYNIIARYKPGEGISLRANDAVFSTTCTTISDRVSTRTYIGESFHSGLANFKGEIAGLYAYARFVDDEEAEAVLSTITNTLTLHTDTGSHSWTEAETYAASQGGRLPTLDELRAYETKTGYFATRNINEWIPVTNPGAPSGADYMMAYNGHGYSIGDSRWETAQSDGDPISSSFGQQEWTGVGQYPVWFSSDLACVQCPFRLISPAGSTSAISCACPANTYGPRKTITSYAEDNFKQGNADDVTSDTVLLSNGFTVELSGWTHTRDYANGYLDNSYNGEATATVVSLTPGKSYEYAIGVWNTVAEYEGYFWVSVNGGTSVQLFQTQTLHNYAGTATAKSDGTIEFKFNNPDNLSMFSVASLRIGTLECSACLTDGTYIAECGCGESAFQTTDAPINDRVISFNPAGGVRTFASASDYEDFGDFNSFAIKTNGGMTLLMKFRIHSGITVGGQWPSIFSFKEGAGTGRQNNFYLNIATTMYFTLVKEDINDVYGTTACGMSSLPRPPENEYVDMIIVYDKDAQLFSISFSHINNGVAQTSACPVDLGDRIGRFRFNDNFLGSTEGTGYRGDVAGFFAYDRVLSSAEIDTILSVIKTDAVNEDTITVCAACPTDGTVVEGCQPPCVDGTSFSYWSIRKSTCP